MFAHSVAAARPSIVSSILAALPYLRVANSVAVSRARLGEMDAAMLADIGLTRAQAQAEAARPIWDVPGFWRGASR